MADEACVTTAPTYRERREGAACPPHLRADGRCCVLPTDESNHRFLGAFACVTPLLDKEVRLGGEILRRLPLWATYSEEPSQTSGGNRLFVHDKERWYKMFVKFCFLAKSRRYTSFYVFATTYRPLEKEFFHKNLTNRRGPGIRLVTSNNGIYLRPTDTELLDFAEGVVTTKTVNIIHERSIPLKTRRVFHDRVVYMSGLLENSFFTSNVSGSVYVTRLPRIVRQNGRSDIEFARVALYIESDKSWENFFVDVFVAFASRSIVDNVDRVFNHVDIDTTTMSTVQAAGLRNLTASEIDADHVRSIGDRYLSWTQLRDTDHTYEMRHYCDQSS